MLVGYDLAARELVLRSGTTERERMGFVLFERTWARGSYWSFVALPPGRLPVTAGEVDAVQAAIGFERVALRHDSAAAWHNLAVVRQRLGQRAAALAAADRALARAPAAEPQWLDAARALRAGLS